MFNLPKLIILALGVAALWYGYRAIKRELARVKSQLGNAQDKKSATGPIQPLEKDADGVYRLKDD